MAQQIETYNFEQAMEAAAHGIAVHRLSDTCFLIQGDKPFDKYKPFQIDFDDFYAKDWVAYEGD